MGNFRQICTELWPSIYVKIPFLPNILSIFRPIFFKLCIRVHIRKEWFEIVDGKFSSNMYRVMALDLLKFRFRLISLASLGKLCITVDIRKEWFVIVDG